MTAVLKSGTESWVTNPPPEDLSGVFCRDGGHWGNRTPTPGSQVRRSEPGQGPDRDCTIVHPIFLHSKRGGKPRLSCIAGRRYRKFSVPPAASVVPEVAVGQVSNTVGVNYCVRRDEVHRRHRCDEHRNRYLLDPDYFFGRCEHPFGCRSDLLLLLVCDHKAFFVKRLCVSYRFTTGCLYIRGHPPEFNATETSSINFAVRTVNLA